MKGKKPLSKDRMIKNICIVCKKEIGEQERCFYDLHRKIFMCMGCEGVEIDVWHVTLADGLTGGYYDTNINHIVDMLNECSYGEGYTIIKEKIRAWAYHTLSEFDGF